MLSHPGSWSALSLRLALPGSYTRALLAAQTRDQKLRLHVGVRMLPDSARGARAIVGWYYGSEAQSWRLEELGGRDPELAGVLRGTWEAIHHARQRGVRVEVVLEARSFAKVQGYLTQLREAAAAGGLATCHLGVDRSCSQLLRRIHAVLGADVQLRTGRRRISFARQLRSAEQAAGRGVRSRASLRTDARHARWLREWARANGYTPCHTDGSAAGNQRSGGWAWWVDEQTWDAGRCEGVVSSNSSELEAVARALADCPGTQPPLVLTDSVYVLRVLAGAEEGELPERVRRLAESRGARFALVKGHQDPAGHDHADELAWAAYHTPAAVRRYHPSAGALSPAAA